MRTPAPRGRVAPCPRSTVISAGASSRTLRPSSTGRRVSAPSLPCPRTRPAPVRRRWSTNTRRCWAVPRRIRRPTARRPENDTAPPPGDWGGAVPLLVPGDLELHDVLRRRAFLALHDL